MKSSDIFVFPCASRAQQYDIQSKALSEKNITNIVKSVVDKESYIISWESNLLKCVINGYYFEISNESLTGTKYAHIIYNVPNTSILAGDTGDGDDSTFAGIIIDSNSNDAALKLCENGEIWVPSKIKFERDSLGFSNLSCGLWQ